MKIKASEIDNLKPGTHIVIKGAVYIRMEDDPGYHIDGCLFNPINGHWMSWARLVHLDAEVEVVEG